MEKQIVGENGISYTLGADGLYYPDLTFPKGTDYQLGKYGSTSHVYVFFYDIARNEKKKTYSFTEEHPLAQIAQSNSRVSVFACRNAVIGGQYGEWCLKREPDPDDTISVNLFFDEDAPEDVNVPLNTEQRGNEGWTGKGEFILPDFAKFVAFLQSLIY